MLSVVILVYDAISTARRYGACISKQDIILPDIPAWRYLPFCHRPIFSWAAPREGL